MNLDEHTVLTRHLAKVQQHCTHVIQQQQKEIERLKQSIQQLELALQARDRHIQNFWSERLNVLKSHAGSYTLNGEEGY